MVCGVTGAIGAVVLSPVATGPGTGSEPVRLPCMVVVTVVEVREKMACVTLIIVQVSSLYHNGIYQCDCCSLLCS